MKLNTLKDLSRPSELGYISTSKLRQEAIKWIKYLDSEECKYDWYAPGWILHFFNITEEDLQ